MENKENRRNSSDRRKLEIDFKRRVFNRRERTFVYQRDIYLSDTNAFQNVYFAKFVFFLGEAREELLAWLLAGNKEFMKSGVGLVTVDTEIKYRASLYVFDRIKVIITVPKLTRMKLYLHFEIRNARTNELNAIADMSIGATLQGKLIELPSPIADPISRHFLGKNKHS